MRSFILVIGLAALAACSRGESDLISFSSDTPDEFGILPTKPLQQPESLAALPPPTPGGRNLVDPTPQADAIVALGGNPAALGRPSTDGALVAYAGRFGVAPGVRTQLATEDAAYRGNNRGRLLERLFGLTTYYDAYERQELDQYGELERLRRAGVRTPAVPPAAIVE